MLRDETLAFITTAIVASFAEVESGSTFRKTCLATEVREGHTKASMLHRAFQLTVSKRNSGF